MSLGLVRHDLSAIEVHDVRDLTLTGLQGLLGGNVPGVLSTCGPR
jgi:hypothetical protein